MTTRTFSRLMTNGNHIVTRVPMGSFVSDTNTVRPYSGTCGRPYRNKAMLICSHTSLISN